MVEKLQLILQITFDVVAFVSALAFGECIHT